MSTSISQRRSIRVLCLFTLLDRGGAETMCMNIYRHIDRTKVQFDFLVYYPQRGQYEDEIESLGGKVYRIPHLDPRNLLNHINGARDFFAKHKEYHVVHNHMGENGCFICREAKKAGVKTIIMHSHVDRESAFHNPLSEEYKVGEPLINVRQLKLNLLRPMAVYYATDYFACGVNAARVFGKKSREAKIIKNAIDIDKFCFNAEIRSTKRREMQCGDKLIVGHVGRVNNNKNQAFAIEVMKKLLVHHPNAELWFIGEGSLKQELSDIVKKEGYSRQIKFLGTRSDVNELLQAMDVFIFPSVKEGLPVSCIEAQTAGLPCVFSDGFDKNTIITENCKSLSLNTPPRSLGKRNLKV